MSGRSAIHAVLGEAFDRLPVEVRRAHGHKGALRLTGFADVEHGSGPLPWLICLAVGLPAAGKHVPAAVEMVTAETGEDVWHREFGGRRYGSKLRAGSGREAGLLVERLGIFRAAMALSVEGDRLVFAIRRFSILGMALPQWLSLRCDAHETGRDGRFIFDIAMALPLIGRVLAYRGELCPTEEAADYRPYVQERAR